MNGAGAQSVSPAYQQATSHCSPINQTALNAINPADALKLKSASASLQLTDGANVSALTTVGNIRANAQTIQQQIANLEQDSLSADPTLNTEMGVLNKINASSVLTLRTMQDANNLRVAALEQQILRSEAAAGFRRGKPQLRHPNAAAGHAKLAPFNSNLTQSLC